jgi:hypothetical protein
VSRRGRQLLRLILLAGILGGCGRGGDEALDSPGASCEIQLHGGRRSLAISGEDRRHAALLTELEKILSSSRPAEAGVLAGLEARDSGRGSLEFRFPASRRYRVAAGDSLDVWRLLLYLDSWPPPEGGALLRLGYPDWEATPRWSERSCREIWRILEH